MTSLLRTYNRIFNMTRLTILFRENGKPIVPSSVKWILDSFPKRYSDVVTQIIESSKFLDKNSFILNTATLLPSFMMTRAGAFKGIKIENGKPVDPNEVLTECWNKIGADLLDIKKKTKNQSRALLELQGKERDYVITKTSDFSRNCVLTGIRRVDRYIV